MVRILITMLGGALILMIWGFLAWSVFNFAGLRAFEDEAAVSTALKDSVPEDGAYFIPFLPDSNSDATANDRWKLAHESGPLGLVLIRPGGEPSMGPGTLLTAFVNYLAMAGLATLLLVAALPRLHGYVSKVAFLTAMGLVSYLIADRTYEIFLYFPSDYVRSILFERLVGWALFGAFAASVIKGGPKV